MYACEDTNRTAAGSSNIDYFVVSNELALAMKAPELVPLSCVKGHRPSPHWLGHRSP